MRLIDADALKKHAGYYQNVTVQSIDAAPTIDAIPVEWLKNLQQESLNENDRNMVGAIEAIFIEWHIYESASEKNSQKEQGGERG